MKSFKISVVKSLIVVFTMLMLGTTSLFAQVSVTYPNVSGPKGTTTNGAVTVSDVTGATSFQFGVTYNKNVVYITGVDVAGTLLAGNASPVVNADTANGKILIAWASATPLSGSGKLLNLVFKFRNTGTTALGIGASPVPQVNGVAGNFIAGNATVPAVSITVGNVSATAAGQDILIPINTTTLVSTDNVLSFNFTATFDPTAIRVTGYDLTTTLGQGGSVSINPNNTTGNVALAWANSVNIVNSGTLVYVKATALKKGSSAFTLTTFKYNDGTPGVTMFPGTITVAAAKPAWGVNNAAPTVNENSTLAFTLVATSADPTDVLTYSVTGLPTGATFNTTTGAFSWTPSFLQAGVYNLSFGVTNGTVAGDPLAVVITVVDVNRTPTLTLNPAGPFTVAEGQTLNITLVGADLDTDNTLTYSATGLPAGATLNATTGAFSWTPDYNQSGSYTIVFKVADNKGASVTVTAAITVTNVNRPPVFTTVMTDQTVQLDQTKTGMKPFNFLYAANDPDGGTITFALEAGPAGSSITTSGLFTWIPLTNQAGKSYEVRVVITDGVLAASTSAILTASSTITGVEDEFSGIPTNYVLMQNYPNPFNPSTLIRFGLPSDSHVRLSVFNILGQEVAVLLDRTMTAGFHKVNFDASNMTSGLYIYRIQADNFVQVRKMMLAK